MNIRAVLKNISDKGLMETWKIYKKRKAKCALTSIVRAKMPAKSSRKYIHSVAREELRKIEQNFSLLESEQKNNDLNELKKNLQQMDIVYKESLRKAYEKDYKSGIKAIFIKEILPELYNLYRKKPVENKVIILQQRKKLNASCSCIYNRLTNDGKYDIKFHELDFKNLPLIESYGRALDFMKDFATAKAVITHEQSELLGMIDIRSETKFIQLWHGLPIKKIRKSLAGMPGYKSEKGFIEYPENNYDLVPISAPEWRPVFEEFMGLEQGTPVIQSMGISRTDQFFNKEYIKTCYDKLYERVPKSKEKKVILYAPTYRGLEPNRTAPDELDVAKFAEVLSDEYILIIKHHQTLAEWPEIPKPYNNDFAYDFRKIKGMDINELLTVADICISDYSSLVFDFSLFERPIVFFAFDEDKYNDERGVYYTLDELDAGPVLKTNEEVIAHIKSMDVALEHERAKKFRERFMCSCDGHANDRIMEYIDAIN